MQPSQHEIRDLIDRVRTRWRRLTLYRSGVRALLAGAVVLIVALALTFWTSRAPVALAVLGVVALIAVAAAFLWGLSPSRRRPTDGQVARFIEEREPSLDDRLASAVDLLADGREADAPGLAGPMVADAARRAAAVDPASLVPGHTLRRAALQAAAAALVLAGIAFIGRDRAERSFDAVSLMLFPSRVTLEVSPGNARLQPGTPLTITARLVGNRAPVVARVLRAEGPTPGDEAWRAAEMIADESGSFTLAVDAIAASFKYRVVAGTLTSPIYDVAVLRAPQVTRIDVDYAYPAALGMSPRTEENGGDIYAPSGTDVRVRVHTDRTSAEGHLALGNGSSLALTPDDDTTLTGSFRLVEDGSYRVALADREGLKNAGDTEYFIRMLEDRPPDVRVLKPARDGTVTPLEEVEVEAQAEDDFGIERLELVYSVRGGAEHAVPFQVPPRTTTLTRSQTLYLEDLDVRPGDFVSYYVRAHDLARGRRSTETRSDIFFLEVKPFEQEFVIAPSQAGGGGGSPPVDDLVNAQKQVIVATWKLDRRTIAARGAKSETDIRSVSSTEAELKKRVEETSSSFRRSTMRDPRPGQSRPGGRGVVSPQVDALRAGQTMAEEDDMTAAAQAMGKAVNALGALKTTDALQPELEALNHLLKAQGDRQKREISRQQTASGAGGNRNGQDLSTLFDKELQKQQQTNYETPTSTEQKDNSTASLLDKIKDLVQRQDELWREQRELARNRQQMAPEELKRELEKLTREQSELRQRAEDVARQMSKEQSPQSQQSAQNQGAQAQSPQSPQGQQNAQSGRGGQSQSGQQSGSPRGGGQSGQQMRDVTDEMRNATSDLRREDPTQASARSERALEKLQALQKQLQSSTPDEQRRARGDLQLEARQLADAERQLASELSQLAPGDKDGLRRLAGEQERLADRARRLEQGLGQQAASGDSGDQRNRDARQAVSEASREFERQRVDEKMQQSAEQLRAAAGEQGKSGTADPASAKTTAAASDRDLARTLDKLADKLATADGPQDAESRKLSDQLARTQELREKIDDLTRRLEQLAQGDPQRSGSSPTGQKSESDTGKPGRGSGGGGADPAQLRMEYQRELQQAKELLDQLRHDDQQFARGGPGITFEGQGMTLSAPGTEAFKQDYSKWEALRKQVTEALERAESSLSMKLQAKESHDRLAAGTEDKPPADYQQQVDNYFKALAKRP